MAHDEPNQKRCSKCGEMRPLEMFARRHNGPLGRAYNCKECHKAYCIANADILRENERKYSIEQSKSISKKPIAEKRCGKCGETKSADMFAKRSGRPGGLHSHCKACKAEYRAVNADTIRVQHREYYVANFETISAKRRDTYATNREAERAWGRAYYAANAKRINAMRQEYSITYRRSNPEIYIAASHRRQARIKENGGSFTASEIKEMRKAQEGKCAYCDQIKNLTIDHIIPVSKGGRNDISNICLACWRCNHTKHARTPEEWVHRWYLEEE